MACGSILQYRNHPFYDCLGKMAFMMCDIGVIFKMMIFSCLLVLLGSIFVKGKRHSNSLECWSKKINSRSS